MNKFILELIRHPDKKDGIHAGVYPVPRYSERMTKRHIYPFRPLILFLSFLLFFSACSNERPSNMIKKKVSKERVQEIQQPSKKTEDPISIEIKPSEATRNAILTMKLNGIAPEAAKTDWLVNGHVVPAQEKPDKFSTAETIKGDAVQARAAINGNEILSNTVMIINTPPELSKVKIMPEVFKPGDKLYIDAA